MAWQGAKKRGRQYGLCCAERHSHKVQEAGKGTSLIPGHMFSMNQLKPSIPLCTLGRNRKHPQQPLASWERKKVLLHRHQAAPRVLHPHEGGSRSEMPLDYHDYQDQIKNDASGGWAMTTGWTMT
jgi:hypothetical protein